MMARRIVRHAPERLLQRLRPFDPSASILAVPDEHNERSHASSITAWMACHERGAGRAIENTELDTRQRREMRHERDRICRIRAPVFGHDQQPQVTANAREAVYERLRNRRPRVIAVPQIRMDADARDEARPIGSALIE
jgi:hypothetical protein